jgi:hypothetical protein
VTRKNCGKHHMQQQLQPWITAGSLYLRVLLVEVADLPEEGAHDSQLDCDHRLKELDGDHEDHLMVSMYLDWRMRRILL